VDRLLKKSVKKFDETIEALLVKCPEYEKENERVETTIVERRDVTTALVDNNQDETTRNSLNSSEVIVDDRFKKITKKRNLNILSYFHFINN
jgi:hypothetical protein